MYGQRVRVTVTSADGTLCANPCANAGCVTTASKSLLSGSTEHALKPMANSNWWGTGPYDTLEVNIGDTVLFQTAAGFHDVAIVPTNADFEACDMPRKTLVADWTYGTTDTSTACKSSEDCCKGSTCSLSGNYVTYAFKANTVGETYFVCSIGNGGHCKTGQKLHVKVKDPAAAPENQSASHAEPAMHISLLAVLARCFLFASCLLHLG